MPAVLPVPTSAVSAAGDDSAVDAMLAAVVQAREPGGASANVLANQGFSAADMTPDRQHFDVSSRLHQKTTNMLITILLLQYCTAI